MPFVPDYEFHLTPNLAFAGVDLPFVGALLPPDLVLTAAVDVLYKSSAYLRVDLGPHTKQDAYALVDARIGASFWNQALWVGVTVENLTNTDAAEFITESLLFPGGLGVIQEFQRNYTFGMKLAF